MKPIHTSVRRSSIVVGLLTIACGSGFETELDSEIGTMSAALSSSAVYEVKGVHSNKCMDIDGASTQNGANVQIWSCLGNGAQQFKFEDMGGGWYRIRNVNSGKCLDVYNWSTSAGGDVRQWDCHTGNNQQWTVEIGRAHV